MGKNIIETKEKILDALEEKEKMETIEEAKDYIERYLNISVTDVSKSRWHLQDEDDDFTLDTDKELIEYANEQKEAEEI